MTRNQKLYSDCLIAFNEGKPLPERIAAIRRLRNALGRKEIELSTREKQEQINKLLEEAFQPKKLTR